jgi:hypothetical protein
VKKRGSQGYMSGVRPLRLGKRAMEEGVKEQVDRLFGI